MNSLASCALRVTRIAALLLLGAVQASAEESPSDSSLRVASGPADKVYAKMVKDMQSVCGAAVAVRPLESTGGLQNLLRLSARAADLGIVQIDTLQEMRAGDENIQKLEAVMRHCPDSGLQLVNFDLAPQKPYEPVKKNYANLGAYNLNFLGVPNLLVTRPFKPGGAMANRVSTLGTCLRKQLDELQEGQNFKPGWKEIKDL